MIHALEGHISQITPAPWLSFPLEGLPHPSEIRGIQICAQVSHYTGCDRLAQPRAARITCVFARIEPGGAPLSLATPVGPDQAAASFPVHSFNIQVRCHTHSGRSHAQCLHLLTWMHPSFVQLQPRPALGLDAHVSRLLSARSTLPSAPGPAGAVDAPIDS